MAKRQQVFKSVKDKAKWISTLLGKDLDAINEIAAFNLLMEYHTLLYGGKKLGQPLFDMATGKKVGQVRISGFDGDAYAILNQARQIARNFLEGLVTLGKDEYSEIRLDYRIRAKDNATWLEVTNAEGEANLLKLAIHEIISHFGLDIIRRCENEPCEELFLKVSKREKIYCSQKCAWQQTTRNARQTPEGRKKKREANRKYYENRLKKQFGDQKLKVSRKKGGKA